jgi:hypothetical protein
MDSKRLVACGFLMAVLLGASTSTSRSFASKRSTSLSTFAAAPTTQQYCQKDHYNTIICGRSHAAVESYCTNAAEYSAPNAPLVKGRGGAPGIVISRYVNGSLNRYRVAFFASDISGCAPTGIRDISYLQELRNGAQGEFRANSKVITVRTDSAYNAATILVAPYNCATDLAGSSVRTVVRIAWIRKKGWGEGSAVRIFHGKSQAIC